MACDSRLKRKRKQENKAKEKTHPWILAWEKEEKKKGRKDLQRRQRFTFLPLSFCGHKEKMSLTFS